MGWFCVLRIGVSDLHHGGGQVGKVPGHAIQFAQTGVAAVDVGAAFFAAEYRPFGEHGKAVEGGGAAAAYHRVGKDPVVEGHIHTVVVPVEGYGFHIDVGIEQFGAADPGAGSAVQQALGACGQIDPQVFDTVFVPTAVGDLAGVDGHGLRLAAARADGVLTVIRHGEYLPLKFGNKR